MPIEFSCPACQAKIRTPDNSGGKSARCPKCSTVVTVPGASTPGPSPTPPPVGFGSSPGAAPANPAFSPPKPPSNYPLGGASSNPLGAPAGNPLGGPPPGQTANPFGDRAQSPYGSPPTNPYASPNPAVAQSFFQPTKGPDSSREGVRGLLIGPAIGLIVGSVIGLGFMAMVVLGMLVDPDQIAEQAPQDPAERMGFYGFFVVYFAGGLITRLLQILGAIALFRVRGYGLAMTGAICALLPCDIYCCLICLPIGIWGLVVLNIPRVKAAYQLP